MSEIIIASARHDENGKYAGGKAGDQTGNEVAIQKYYLHKKGWTCYRAINANDRKAIAEAFLRACNNDNIGYSQSDRYSLEKYGTNTNVPCNTDCSELARVCIREAIGKDIGAVTTANLGSSLIKTRKFNKIGVNLDENLLSEGDILCTCTKGHVVCVVKGNERGRRNYIKVAKPTIRIGSRGTEVSTLQKNLNDCNNSGLNVDGNYGPLTRSAVIAFQKNNGLVPDGIYGPKTYAKMKEKFNV